MIKKLIMDLTGIYLVLTTYQITSGFIVQEPVQNASLHEMYTALKQEISTLSAKSSSLLKNYNILKLENENLKVELETLKSTAADIQVDLTNATAENMNLQNELENVLVELVNITSSVEKLNSANQFLKEQYSILNRQYLNLKNKIENQSKENNGSQEVLRTSRPRVGFSVSWPEREPYGQIHEGPLKFSNTFYDDDNVYNSTSGEFVCKTPGLYLFSSMIIRQVGQHTESSCFIMVNNISLAYLEAYSFNASYGSPSATGITLYHMQEGDTASINNCTNAKQIAGYSNFNGFLLDAD